MVAWGAPSAEVAVAQPAPSKLMQWAMDAQQANLIAQSLAKTSFVPRSMQGKPAEVTAAILAGQELGLEPMASLRSLNIIEGTPALTAVAMRGLVQSKGHDVWLVESTETRAIVEGRRSGSEETQRSTWTTERAKKLGLLGKQNWQKQPQAMLVARATSELCRLIAADVLVGVPYSAEELNDDFAPSIEVKPTARSAKRTVQRKPLPQPEVEPELEPEPVSDEPDEPAGDIAEPELSEDWPPVAGPGGES